MIRSRAEQLRPRAGPWPGGDWAQHENSFYSLGNFVSIEQKHSVGPVCGGKESCRLCGRRRGSLTVWGSCMAGSFLIISWFGRGFNRFFQETTAKGKERHFLPPFFLLSAENPWSKTRSEGIPLRRKIRRGDFKYFTSCKAPAFSPGILPAFPGHIRGCRRNLPARPFPDRRYPE